MTAFWRDVRFGLRMLSRKPAFTTVTVLTLALGIALTTAIFTVVDGVLLRALPVQDPARLFVVHNQMPKINLPRTQVSGPQYVDYSRQTNAFQSTAAMSGRNFNLTGIAAPERLQAARVTAGFFATLGVNPIAGRFFTAEEDRIGNERHIVLSNSLWKRLFNSAPNAVGTTLELSGSNYEVVGVAPEGVQEIYPNADLWIPMAFTERELSEERRGSLAFTMIARLKQGVDLKQAQNIMSEVAQGVSGGHLDEFGIEVRSVNDEYLTDVRKPLLTLGAAVLVVLLISCANIANLLLARASSRGHEMAVRAALGADRTRLIRQLFTESGLIAVLGGTLGILFALWGTRLLLRLAPSDLPRLSSVSLNFRVLIFSVVVSIISGLIFGLIPALAASRANLVNSLKDSERTDSAGVSRQRLRRVLVVSEVALALILLVSAGLLIRSFGKILDVKPGFNPHNVLTLRLSLPGSQYNSAAKIAGFYDAALPRIASLPGVEHAAAAFQTPFTSGGDDSLFHIRSRVTNANDPAPHADYAYVSSDYFKAMGLPILKGRDFQPSDMRARNYFAPNSVAIIDEELAKRFWPNGDALGGGISWSAEGPWATVVGICATAQLKDLTEESKGTFYLPSYFQSSTIVVRTSTDPRSLAGAIKNEILAVDKNQPVYDVKLMNERVASTLETRRFAVLLLTIFSGFALLLAAIGLYGVLAFMVSQRTREIGIHIALGAQRSNVMKMVVRQGMILVGVGVTLGVAGAYVATRVIESLLFEVSPRDPLTYGVIALLLVVVGLAACYIPARRATRVDPLVALRSE